MYKEKGIVWIILVLLVCLLLPQAISARLSVPADQPVPLTTITVNSGLDIDNTADKICTGEDACTLRRAIVEANGLSVEERPVLIAFDIPATAEEGYDSTLDAWELEIKAAGNDEPVFPILEGGQIMIDGTTQPGGRAEAPKIILVGPATGNKDALVLGVDASGDHDLNGVTGLAFQNFQNHVFVNSNENMIDHNWFGLTSDGNAPYLRNGDAQDGSGRDGITLGEGVNNNTIIENVFLGFDGTAVILNGDHNTFRHNNVGTDADGEVPGKETDPALVCSSADWLGGGGLIVDGDYQYVNENVFAGLRQHLTLASMQPDAIHVSSSTMLHEISGNYIGLTLTEKPVGVCGRGINMDEPYMVRVEFNRFANTGYSAIALSGAGYDGNPLRTNTILQETPWPEDVGDQAEDAIQLGASLPQSLLNFEPAVVTSVEGTVATGTSAPGSLCPHCVVELFLDDNDTIVEALESLAVVTTDDEGNWQVDLSHALGVNQGLRTTSTSRDYDTIPGLNGGTNTGLSVLYAVEPAPEYEYAFLPLVIGK